jgi:hypothetical protein
MVTNETVTQGNKFVVVSDADISLEELLSETNWSDHNLVMPLLFDFYHGVEVLLKGFLVCKGRLAKKNHKLSSLLATFSSEYPGHKIGSLLATYITTNSLPEPLASFCSESAISIDDYYQALKYPESATGAVYRHTPLKNRGEAGLEFFLQLARDINQLRLEAVALGRSICPGA